jgi:streptogramin lyase/two-component sensor histidine kinase
MPTRFFTEPASINPYVMIREGKYIWMATEGNGLVRFDPQTKDFHFFEYFNYRKYLAAPRFLVSMIKDRSGRLWMGTYYGLYFKAPGKDSFYAYSDLVPKNGLPKILIPTIRSGSNGDVWLGTEQGLFCLDEKTLRIKKHYLSFAENQSHPTTILSIDIDSKGILWMGTKGEGLVRFDPQTEKSGTWSTNEGLSDNVVYSVLIKNNHVWAATHNGFNHFDTVNSRFYHFYVDDGLAENEFNHGAALRSKSGDLYFGTINGLTRFNPGRMQLSGASSPLVLTHIERYNPKTGALQAEYANLAGIKTINLPYDNRYLNVYFALTDYARSDKNTYRYILEGYDTKWHNLGSQNYISMLGIPAGKYVLRIEASGSNGLANASELRIPIIVEEIFYKTWWFIVLAIIFILSMVAGLYFYRIRQYKKLISLRTQIASDLHDEVGSHLTRIAISSDLMKDSPDNRVDALIDHIADSSRQAVATMSDVIWSIDTRSDRMGSLLDRMREHARNIFEPAGINYNIEAKNLGENDKVNMDQRHDLYLIFKEATNNILKHSNATEARIELENKNGRLRMKISDNGTVPPNPHRTTGMGIRNMQMRAKRMKGELDHHFNKGFTVLFTGKAHT